MVQSFIFIAASGCPKHIPPGVRYNKAMRPRVISFVPAVAIFLWGAWVFARYFRAFKTHLPLSLQFGFLATRPLAYPAKTIIAVLCTGILIWVARRMYGRFAGRWTFRGEKHRARAGIYVRIALVLAPFFTWPLLQIAFRGDPAIALRGIGAVGLLALFGLAALGTGLRTARAIKLEARSFAEAVAIGGGLGFGVFMYAGLLLGALRIYYSGIAYLLVGLALLFGFRELAALWRMVFPRVRTFLIAPGRVGGAAILIAITLATMFSAGIFLQHPVGYDAMISYFTYPQEYVREHRMVAFPFWPYWGFPQNAEMLFTLGWLLLDFRVAIGVIFMFTLLLGAALWLLMERMTATAKALASLFFFTIPVIAYQNFFDHKAEIIFAFYVLLSYVLFLRYARTRERGALIACGLISGIAAGTKYFFLPWYALPVIFGFLWLALRARRAPRELFFWGIIVTALFLPWMVKNVVVSGNPFDPVPFPEVVERDTFFESIGPGARDFFVEEMRNEAYLLWDDAEKKDIKFFLKAPLDLTFGGNKKYFSDSLRLGPLLLFLLPLVFLMAVFRFRSLRNSGLLFTLLALPVLVAGWIWIGRLVMWYAIPLYALYAALAGWAVAEVRTTWFRRIVLAALALWMAVFVSEQYLRRLTYSPLYFRNHIDTDLSRVSQYVNEQLPKDALIWGLREPRGFLIERSYARYVPDHYHLAFSWMMEYRGADETMRFFRDHGVRYLLLYGSAATPDLSNLVYWTYQEHGSDRYADLIQRQHRDLLKFLYTQRLELIRREGRYYLYRLPETGPSDLPQGS